MAEQQKQGGEARKVTTSMVICSPMWFVGFLLLFAATALNGCKLIFINDLTILFNNLGALNFASIILISSTSCATIIFNTILAPIFLNESFSLKRDGILVLFLTVGTLLCVNQTQNEKMVLEDEESLSSHFTDVISYHSKKLF